MAVALVRTAQGRDNRRVLGPARINAKANTRTMPVNQPAALMRAIWKKHGFPGARPHDLRRTAATLIQSAVLPDRPMKWTVEEVGWLLGHRNENGGPVTLVYARYDHFDEKRAMAATLERELTPHPCGQIRHGAHGGIEGAAPPELTRQWRCSTARATGDPMSLARHPAAASMSASSRERLV